MRIWKIEGGDLLRLAARLDSLRETRYVRIAVDGDTVKVKRNEDDWSAPLGVLEVDRPETDLDDPIAVDVLAECRNEAVRSLEHNPQPDWSPADIAADIVLRLTAYYELEGLR